MQTEQSWIPNNNVLDYKNRRTLFAVLHNLYGELKISEGDEGNPSPSKQVNGTNTASSVQLAVDVSGLQASSESNWETDSSEFDDTESVANSVICPYVNYQQAHRWSDEDSFDDELLNGEVWDGEVWENYYDY